jgi:putative Mg2+ transporter-C (MgtC) family protein
VVTLSLGELLLRLGLTLLLCGLIGLERESRDQVAGLRTHILVGLGAALFTIVSAYGFEDFLRGADGAPPRYDPTRIAAQIVSGIGFLGAGAIIRQGFNVRGVTTAAALWIVAAVGMAAGAGYYEAAVATTAIVLPSLVILRKMRPALMRRMRVDYFLVEADLDPRGEIGRVLTLMAERGLVIQGLRSELSEDERSFEIDVRVPPAVSLEPVLEQVSDMEGVRRVTSTGRGTA